MNFFQLLFLLSLWILPIFLLINAFLKMDKQEKEEIKKELTQPLVLLATVLNCLGLLLFFSGLIISTTKLQYIGAFMIIIGWILGCIITWKKAFKEV